MQTAARGVFEYTREFWDTELTPDLVDRVLRSSDAEIRRFSAGWPELAIPKLESEIPDLIGAQMRPAFGPWSDRTVEYRVGPVLLLYVESIVVSSDPLLGMWNWFPEDQARRHIDLHLRWLAEVKPLVESDAIWFTTKSRGIHPSRSTEASRILKATTRDDWAGTSLFGLSNEAFVEQRGALGLGVLGNMPVINERHGTALALNADEIRAFEILLGSEPQRRQLRLSELARMVEVPDFKPNVQALVDLRTAGAFGAWRTALSNALDQVTPLPDTAEGLLKAREIVADELRISLEDITREANTSPAITAIRGGWRKVGIRTLTGASVGAFSNEPALGAISGAASGLVDAAIEEYFAAKEKTAKGRAIRDTILEFRSA